MVDAVHERFNIDLHLAVGAWHDFAQARETHAPPQTAPLLETQNGTKPLRGAIFQGDGRSVMLVLRPLPSEVTVLTVTRDMVLPTTITGSYPRPLWFDRSLDGRSFKSALGDSLFREQYLDAVASIIAEQEAAGLDIVTDGDSRFDLTVGGKSWFFYPIERLGGVCGHRDTSRGWMSRHGLRPGKILWEVQEAYQPGVVRERLSRGPLEYAALWQVAQRMTDRPVKFGAICAPALASMLWNEFYKDDKAMALDLCEIMNAELRDMAAAGCPLIQVEEPPHHMRPAGRLHGCRS